MIVYISGKYSGDVITNIEKARKVAIEVWESGSVALTPHLNTAQMEIDCKCPYEDYIKGDLELLARCDCILMLAGWEDSKGAVIERDFANQYGIPIYYYPDIPAKETTEILRPNQSHAFISIIMKMYRVHLAKNADYSPANIAGTGMIGLCTRIWDKCARLMNLTGFNIEIINSTYIAPKEPKNESIEDNYLDLAVYGVIGLLYRMGAWGK